MPKSEREKGKQKARNSRLGFCSFLALMDQRKKREDDEGEVR
jgi:hypothetical protein